jgi:hypothetical protein
MRSIFYSFPDRRLIMRCSPLGRFEKIGPSAVLHLDRGALVLKLGWSLSQGETMSGIRSRWLSFYAEHLEPLSKELFGHVEK